MDTDMSLPLFLCFPTNASLFVTQMYKQVKKTKQSGKQWLAQHPAALVLPEQEEHMQSYASTISYCRIVMYFYTLLCSRINPLPCEMAVLLLPGQNTSNDMQCAAWLFGICGDSSTVNLAPIFALVCKMRTFKKPSKQQSEPVPYINWKRFKKTKAQDWPYFEACVDLFPKMQQYVHVYLNKYSMIKVKSKHELMPDERRLTVSTNYWRKSLDWSDFHAMSPGSMQVMGKVGFISVALQYMILKRYAEGEMIYKLVFH